MNTSQLEGQNKKMIKFSNGKFLDSLSYTGNNVEGNNKNVPFIQEQSAGKINNSFNWGFLAGVLFSAAVWIVVIYLLK